MKSSPATPNSLLRAAGKLKKTKRAGWVKKARIVGAESVADHSFRMAILAAYLSVVKRLDQLKVIRMCLIHDLAESEIGDIVPEEKESERKHRELEDVTVRRILATLPSNQRKRFIKDWEELLSMKTREAKLVWQIDKLEMGLQMKEYLADGFDPKRLKNFDPSKKLTPDLRKLLAGYDVRN